MMPAPFLLPLLFLFQSGAAPADRFTFPEIARWTRTADSSRYTPANLWDLIDGAAETYLLYGFRELTVGEYAAVGCTVRVEVYTHASPTMAFGIYATERQPEYNWVTVGTEGYQEEGVLNFLAGSHYCKLTTHERGERARSGMLEVARGIDLTLGGPRKWPEGLRYLPIAGKSPYTEGYVPSEILGYSFLKEGFAASYGGGTRLYAIRAESSAGARSLAERYATLTAAKEDPHGSWQITDPNNGPVFLLLHGRLLYIMVNGPPSELGEILRAVKLLAD